MQELGMRERSFITDNFSPITIHGRPTEMPQVPSVHHQIICGYDHNRGDRLFLCETLEEMQELYDAYEQAAALGVNWYIGKSLDFIKKSEAPHSEDPHQVRNIWFFIVLSGCISGGIFELVKISFTHNHSEFATNAIRFAIVALALLLCYSIRLAWKWRSP